MAGTVTITSGKYRGRKLVTPESQITHPMGAREKLALFNMLQPYLSGAKVLDIYAGTGALGLEALSRGALGVTFIENNSAALRCLRQNLAILGQNDQSNVTIFPGKASIFASNEFYDLILVDPPYDHFHLQEVAKLASFLAPGGIFALSHPSDADINFESLQRLTARKYANACITIFENQITPFASVNEI